jgi:UDP-N-acetylmuramoylalanine--D-glutamate ligase
MYLNQLIQLNQSNRKIAIIGFGKENQQFLEWLLNVVQFNPSKIILADKNSDIALDGNLISKLDKSNFYFGDSYLDCLLDSQLDWVFKAPGIHSLKREFQEFRKNKGDFAVTSGMIFFLEKFKDKIIGITGTKGKSTTSSLTAFLIKNILNQNVEYCGNTTGISPYSFWQDLDYTAKPDDYWVIELSSFQLQDIGFAKLSPARSIITNYHIDHQDQHNNVPEYWLAKDQIFLHGENYLVANHQIVGKSKLKNDNILLFSEENARRVTSKLNFHLPGEHNLMNLAEALAIVANIQNKDNNSVDKVLNWVENNQSEILQNLSNFQGLPHRFELIRQDKLKIKIRNLDKTLNLVWIDDGYATESDAVVAAIKSVPSTFGHFLWLWLAGVDKGSGLKALVDAILEKQIHSELYSVEYCGSVGKRTLSELYETVGTKQDFPLVKLKDTVESELKSLAFVAEKFSKWIENYLFELEQSDQNDVLDELLSLNELSLHIVLSPSGSSFDEFKNAGHRADWWVELVKNLA